MSGKTVMSRRGFLILVGGAISASVLPYDRITASDTRQSVVEFIESRCEKDRKMKSRILIAYGSRCGSTVGWLRPSGKCCVRQEQQWMYALWGT